MTFICISEGGFENRTSPPFYTLLSELKTAPLAGFLAATLAGCASYAPIENQALESGHSSSSYSLAEYPRRSSNNDERIMLAFSGGGTRAAALSYGVLKALRDTPIPSGKDDRALLDSVSSISSVSGGSFTAAYYGLFGDAIFDDFENDFLRKNVQGDLLHFLANPFNWFTLRNRTEWAIDYYDKYVFRGATFDDLQAASGPMILINASDLVSGIGFWFVQDFFGLLCSDISTFPVARAVAASSAVPGVFSPVVLQNHDGCEVQDRGFLEKSREQVQKDPDLEMVQQGLESYLDKKRKPYAHLVDGGVTDNLGLRSVYELPRLLGGARNYYQRVDRKPPRRLIVIAVDAGTPPSNEISESNRFAPVTEVLGAVSTMQLHRYNADTLMLMQDSMQSWSESLSTPDHPVEAYFINLRLSQAGDPETQAFLDSIPTSFSLSEKQVDMLIDTGGRLLRENPEFRKLIADLASDYL